MPLNSQLKCVIAKNNSLFAYFAIPFRSCFSISLISLLSKASHRITNEVRGISRVVYDITSNPPRNNRAGVIS
ncbi:MAG: hypothetical protein WCR95_00830 [Eubacteriales bacterium]